MCVYMSRKRDKFDKWDFFVVLMIFISLICYIISTHIRTSGGSYWSVPWIIIMNDVSESLFGSLFFGYILMKVVQKATSR